MGNFKYRKRDASAVKERANQSGGAFDSYTDTKVPRFKVQDGDNNIRILPPPPDIDQERWGQNWGIELWLHGGVGSDKSSYLCVDKMKGKPCALCERLRDLDDEDLIDKLKAKKRILCFVIDRDDEGVGPQLFSMAWTLEKEISGRCIDKKTGEILYIDDPDEGYDVSFTREGKGKKTKYGGEEIARESSPLCDNQKTQDKWLQFISDNPLPELLKYYDEDHLRKVFAGQKSREEDEDGDKDKDERPTRRRAKEDEADERPRRSKKDEEEEREERPRRRGRDEEEERPTSRAESAETNSRRKTDARSADQDRVDDDNSKGRRKSRKLTLSEVEDMDADELAEVVEAHKLTDVDIDDYPKVAGLRRAVIEALEETGDLEEEEESKRRRSNKDDDDKPTHRSSNGEDKGDDDERPTRRSRGKTDEDGEEDETARGQKSLGRLRDRERSTRR